ncbi:MAG: hypothetical protein ACK41T_10160 [Pseudobdellovibrio sp.]
MYKQLILSLTFIIFSISHASTPSHLTKLYASFENEYNVLLTTLSSKNDFLARYPILKNSLDKKYDEFTNLEGDELTPEGNQMALDLEMLTPLQAIFEHKISSDGCTLARQLNEMNSNADLDTYKKINILIKNLCTSMPKAKNK